MFSVDLHCLLVVILSVLILYCSECLWHRLYYFCDLLYLLLSNVSNGLFRQTKNCQKKSTD